MASHPVTFCSFGNLGFIGQDFQRVICGPTWFISTLGISLISQIFSPLPYKVRESSSLRAHTFCHLFSFGCAGVFIAACGLFCSFGGWTSHWGGFSCCSAQALECRFSSRSMHVGSPQTRDQTHVPSWRQILNHWITRVAQYFATFYFEFSLTQTIDPNHSSHITVTELSKLKAQRG